MTTDTRKIENMNTQMKLIKLPNILNPNLTILKLKKFNDYPIKLEQIIT